MSGVERYLTMDVERLRGEYYAALHQSRRFSELVVVGTFDVLGRQREVMYVKETPDWQNESSGEEKRVFSCANSILIDLALAALCQSDFNRHIDGPIYDRSRPEEISIGGCIQDARERYGSDTQPAQAELLTYINFPN